MAKQYHFVLMFDDETKELSIDWDTTQIALEEDRGTIFDTDTQDWELGFDEADYEAIADKVAKKLMEVQL